MSSRTSRGTLGLAVGPTGITAVLQHPAGERVETVSAMIDVAAADLDSTLTLAFQQMQARLGTAATGGSSPRRASLALLPPLAECRLLQLPPLRAAEAAAVVRRDAGRYFVAVPAPRTAAARVPPRGAGGPVLGAATSAILLEALHRAAAAVQWELTRVVPAHAAWAAGAPARGVAAVVSLQEDTLHVITLRDGAMQTLRRLPLEDVNEIGAVAGAPGTALINAPPDVSAGVSRQLAAAGWTVTAGSRDAAQAAATRAGTADPPLVAVSAEVRRQQQERRLAGWLAAAAVILLAGSAAVEMWGAHRELEAVRARRAEIRGTVGPLLSLRDSVDVLSRHSSEIEAVANSAPRWTGAIFELTMLLPPETHLTRLHTTGDTIVVEAEGNRAGATLQAMRSAGSLRDARLLGGVERELADGATAVERFRLSARLAPPPERSTVASSAPGGGR